MPCKWGIILSLEPELKKIIGPIWYIRGNFDVIIKNKLIIDRAESVECIVKLMANYNPKKKSFEDRLVLDNFMGSLQNYLTGSELQSIHLSSKAMEVAFLMKIETPTLEEITNLKGRVRSFEALRDIALNRRLIKTQEGSNASRRVIDRRNMAVHDAILKQAIQIEQAKWVERIQERIPKQFRTILVTMFFSEYQKRVKDWESLPDFSWYVTKKSDDVTRKLLQEFFNILDKKMVDISSFPDKNMISNLRLLSEKITKIKDSLSRGEANFMKHCAKENLKDTKIVLDDLYERRLLA